MGRIIAISSGDLESTKAIKRDKLLRLLGCSSFEFCSSFFHSFNRVNGGDLSIGEGAVMFKGRE